ncbi:Putative signal protein with GAF, PAS(PAC) and GGDEF domains [Rhodanobacter sp. Root179]|uniref:sensor domain-containing diguanylate cyclase n=1 Tax=unclassified Rhodanobacter TaxID=2621553 RepID=UPI00070108A3|nr:MULTISPECIES: diguanylate cyclase [unclassified Rhodanobacter]KQZ70992.1 PAS domain S-box protein [Rhodanobacter sp. Root561]KRB37450.1 PAS domain S-box protein [Rhodanobacter sp. Root179]
MPAPVPAEEAQRLARLHALSVLDSGTEPLFDALTRSAALVTGAPMALLALVDGERPWFKSRVGLAGLDKTPRASDFSEYAMLAEGLMEVVDARADPRFADNPLVTGSPHVRFLAGAPLQLGDGLRVGALCVFGREPRSLDETQRQALLSLALVASEALELRMLALERHPAVTGSAPPGSDEAARLAQKLRASEAFLDRTGRLAGVGGWQVDLGTDEVQWTDETCRIHEVPAGYRPTVQEALAFYPPKAREVIFAAMTKGTADRTGWDLELPLVTATGRKIWVRTIGSIVFDDDGKPVRLVGAIQDVSIRRRVVTALEASDRRFRKLFEYSLGLICTHDYEGVLLSVNPAAARSLGYSIGELLGRPLTDFMRPERHAAFRAYLLRLFRNDRDEGVLELVAKDGTLRIWQYQNMLDDEDEDPYVLGHAQDITEQYQQALNLHEMSVRDPLTGCYNRRFLDDVGRRSAQGRWGCVVIDLDHFKQVNDTYGHQRGDEVLVAMAHFLSRHVRPGDAVIRLGGDEFMVLLGDAADGAVEGVVSRIEHDRADAPIAFTLGWSTFGHEVTLDQGMAEADHQLYRKREARGKAGRN